MAKTTQELMVMAEQDEAELTRQTQEAGTDGNAMSQQPVNAESAPIEPAPAPVAPVAAQPEPAPTAAPDSVPLSEYKALADQLRSFKDTLNGTKGQMAQQLKDLSHENEVLKLKLEQLAKTPAKTEINGVVDDDLAELTAAFGPDAAKAMGKLVATKTAKIEALITEVASLRSGLKQEVQTMTNEQRQQMEINAFKASAIADMPGLDKLCAPEGEFQSWMERTDDGYGGTMLRRFDDAFNNRNIAGMRKVVREFGAHCKKTGTALPPGVSIGDVSTIPQAPANSGSGLREKVVPSRSGATNVSTAGNEPLTVNDVAEAEDVLTQALLKPGHYPKTVIDKAQEIVDRADLEGYKA